MTLSSAVSKLVYWPLCRAYARRIGDRPADLLMSRMCTPAFRLAHGYWPNLDHPKSFTEKLFYRMLYDRDPMMTLLSDKLGLRDYVAKKVGSDCLIPLLWTGRNSNDIPFRDLPKKFVIKANHGCDFNIIVRD